MDQQCRFSAIVCYVTFWPKLRLQTIAKGITLFSGVTMAKKVAYFIE